MYGNLYSPFYRNYQNPQFWEEEQLQEREDRLMNSFYPETARQIRQKIEEECDRVDYPGSFLYDEYPDRLSLQLMCRRVKGKLQAAEDGRDDRLYEELIYVLLCQEIHKRRMRNHRHRKYFL